MNPYGQQPNWRFTLLTISVFLIACAIGGRAISDLLAPLVPIVLVVLILALLGARLLRRW